MAAGWSLAWRLARRELRGGFKGLGVFLACLALGVAAIAAVGVVNAGVLAALARDARVLLGGDLEIVGTNFPVEPADIAAVTPPGAALSEVVRTNAMARADDGRRLVVQLKAVDDAYPLYGEVRLDPPIDLDAALVDGGAVAERALFARLGLSVGDTIQVGEAEFRLRAVIEREPDRVGGYLSIGPRVLVHGDRLAATGIMVPGSLARYQYRLALPPGVDPAAHLRAIRDAYPDARWRARGFDEVQPRIARFTGPLATYLTLAGMTALLVGGLGIALATAGYLGGKGETIATLKCLGAPSRLVFRVYLLQVLALAALGVALGLALGQAAPLLLRFVPDGVLPVEAAAGFYPLPLLIAAGCGLLVALAFTVWPLARARDVSPAGLFRDLVAPARRWPRAADLGLLAASLAGLAALAVLGVASHAVGAAFVGVAAVGALLLAGLALLALRALRPLGRQGGATLRLALANLHRPGSNAASVIVALGAGLAVLTAVALLQSNLLAEIETRLPERAPSVVFIDIQPDQLEAFAGTVAGFEGAAITQRAPLIRGRVVRIGGVPVDEVAIDPDVQWTVRRDRGLTYSAAMPEGTRLVAGAWWPEGYAGPPLVSVDADVAAGYAVGVGDRLSFNVLGRVIEAEIASLREIDWQEARLNFVFVFGPGALEAAPHTVVAAVEVPEPLEPALLDAVADAFPNVTPLSIRELIATASEIMARIGLAVRLVGGLTLLSGVLVLAGAIAAARQRHLYQSVVLKVLGAERPQLLRVFLLEYLGLGLAAVLAGGLLGTLGALAVVTGVMDLPWRFSIRAVAEVALAALAITLVAGFIGTWRVLGRPAAPVLRGA